MINTIGPALCAKYSASLLNKDSQSIYAVLSARVGSISDNRLGGWYGYRASKAALNMFLKTYSIELSRNNKSAIAVGLHPGTVDTSLSKPFQSRVPKEQLLTPECAAQYIVSVLENLKKTDSGAIFAWDGTKILP